MPLQTSVPAALALGVPGALYDTSPTRITAYNLAGTGEHQQLGRVAAKAGESAVTATGGPTAAYAGVLCNPGAQARATLDASLQLVPGAQVEVATMGRIVVALANTAQAGNAVIYNVNTGEIAPHAGGALPANHAQIPNAVFFLGGAKDAMGVIELR